MTYYVTLWTPSGEEVRYPGYKRVEVDSLKSGAVFPECSDDCATEVDYFRTYNEEGYIKKEGALSPSILISRGVAPKVLFPYE